MDAASEQTDEHPIQPKSSLREAIELVSDQSTPLEAGFLEIGEDGTVRRRPPGPSICAFEYRGAPFQALIVAGDEARVRLTANLGKMPFSAESPIARRLIAQLIAGAERLPRGRIALGPGNEIVLETEEAPPAPRTPVSVMATIIALLLDIKPYLELLAELLTLATRRDPLGASPPTLS